MTKKASIIITSEMINRTATHLNGFLLQISDERWGFFDDIQCFDGGAGQHGRQRSGKTIPNGDKER